MSQIVMATLATSLAAAARSLLGVLFLRAALPKLRDPAGFAGIVGEYRLLPTALVRPAAASLVVAELVAGPVLLAGIVAPGRLAIPGAMLALLLLLGFVAAMSATLRRGRAGIACGCGTGPAALSWSGVGLTLALLPAALLALWPGQEPTAWLVAQGVLAGLLLLALHDASRHLLQPRTGAPA